jgi:hypothetical protein
MNYTLALVHLGDRCVGAAPFAQTFPGAERAPTLAEVQEIQRRLSALGFDTGGADGRVGKTLCSRCKAFSARLAWSRLTATPASSSLPACAKVRDPIERFGFSGEKTNAVKRRALRVYTIDA